MTLLALVLAGAAGAAARYVVDVAVTGRTGGTFPWGTLVVNVAGAFLLGGIAGTVTVWGAPDAVRTVAGTGFCGSFTTFSTLVYETLTLAGDGQWRLAALNLATLLAGGAAAGAGLGAALVLA